MGRKCVLFLLFGFLVILFASRVTMAQHKHDHGSSSPSVPQKGSPDEMHMGTQPAQATTMEGLKITFEVMDMSQHMSMPGMKGSPQHDASAHSMSHAIMVKVQDTASKEIISDARVSFTIFSPSGEKETGTLEWSGDHYGGSFSPKEKGAYQVQLTVESGGMNREAKFTYEKK